MLVKTEKEVETFPPSGSGKVCIMKKWMKYASSVVLGGVVSVALISTYYVPSEFRGSTYDGAGQTEYQAMRQIYQAYGVDIEQTDAAPLRKNIIDNAYQRGTYQNVLYEAIKDRNLEDEFKTVYKREVSKPLSERRTMLNVMKIVLKQDISKKTATFSKEELNKALSYMAESKGLTKNYWLLSEEKAQGVDLQKLDSDGLKELAVEIPEFSGNLGFMSDAELFETIGSQKTNISSLKKGQQARIDFMNTHAILFVSDAVAQKVEFVKATPSVNDKSYPILKDAVVEYRLNQLMKKVVKS